MLGPLFFLILINDLAKIKLANLELEKASDWFKANKLTLNLSKTK